MLNKDIMMKKKESKLVIFISILIVIFSTFIYFVFKPYEYKQEYFINEYKVEEKFNKQDKYYTFTITNGNEKYVYLIENKYSRKRELIQEIQIAKNEDEICILPKSNKIAFYPLCNSDNNIYAYNLSNIKDLDYKYNKIKNFNEEYKNIKLNKLNNISFLLYNYKGFYLINEKAKKDIKLFDKDMYTIQLIYQQDQYLLVPDYNQSYFFNKIYVINILNGKIKEIDFEYDISYESIFLGSYKNNVYLLDKKEEKEYKINIKKNKIEEIEFQTLEENKMVKKDFKKIKPFTTKNIFEYEIIDGKIYHVIDNNKIRISNLDVDKIVSTMKDTVYYLSNENLYMYSNQYGEILLISNFEWNFNNTNMIYLYK